jgi:hypothetical protein
MKPGRELDVLVAKQVMGIDPDYDEGIYYFEGYADPKPYSTDITAAWEVVEKFNRRYLELIKDGRYKCCLDSRNLESLCAFADTAPHAICLAALKAVENK